MGSKQSIQDKEDGSERERTIDNQDRSKRKAREVYYIAELMDDSTTPIMDMPPLILEKVFEKISLMDLSQLSSTCKKLNNAVWEYLQHQCHSKNIMTKFNDFVTANENLLTIREQKIIPEIKKDLETIQDEDTIDRKRIYQLLANVKLYDSYSRRFSFVDSWAPHKGTHYIPIKNSEDVNRNIVYVQDVCWLQFKHSYGENLDPGTYSISIQLKVKNPFKWPHDASQTTKIHLTYCGKTDTVEIYRDWWNALHKTRNTGAGAGIPVVDGIKNVKWHSGWFKVTFDDVYLEEKSDISFELIDVDCPWWKGGICLDFLEIRRKI